MRALVEDTLSKLAGYQAIDLYEAYQRLGGEGDPEVMPIPVREFLCQLLSALGYRERCMVKVGDDEGHLFWSRETWELDREALSRAKEVESYRAF